MSQNSSAPSLSRTQGMTFAPPVRPRFTISTASCQYSVARVRPVWVTAAASASRRERRQRGATPLGAQSSGYPRWSLDRVLPRNRPCVGCSGAGLGAYQGTERIIPGAEPSGLSLCPRGCARRAPQRTWVPQGWVVVPGVAMVGTRGSALLAPARSRPSRIRRPANLTTRGASDNP